MNEKVDLAVFPFFSGISSERLSQIESFSILQYYDENDVIFLSNEPARNLYGVIKGEVELTLLFKEEIVTKDIKYEEYIATHVEVMEKPIVIEQVEEQGIFGWSSLVEPEIMTATARCKKDCGIILIPASDLKNMFHSDPEFGYLMTSRLNALISRRLNSRTEKLVEAWCQLFEYHDINPTI